VILHHDRQKLKLLAGTIDLLRSCRYVGRRAAGEPPLPPSPRCDLCRATPKSGRLLEGDFGIGYAVSDAGEVTFRPFPCPGTVHGVFWLCTDCWWRLDRNPPALLLKLARAHGVRPEALAAEAQDAERRARRAAKGSKR
jgi:hypothetical protein